MDDIKYIDLREFMEAGYLQEVNRQFFHPLGLALELKIHENGNVYIGGIWDYREDPEGINFGDSDLEEKARSIRELQDSRRDARLKALGYWIQPGELGHV